VSAAGPMPVPARPTGPTDAAPAAHGHGGPGDRDWPGPLADRDNRNLCSALTGRPVAEPERRRARVFQSSDSSLTLQVSLPRHPPGPGPIWIVAKCDIACDKKDIASLRYRMRYLFISHGYRMCDILYIDAIKQFIACDIALRYRMRYRKDAISFFIACDIVLRYHIRHMEYRMRYRTAISHAISLRCDIFFIVYDIALRYHIRHVEYRMRYRTAISHAISLRCDIFYIAYDIALRYHMRYKQYRT